MVAVKAGSAWANASSRIAQMCGLAGFCISIIALFVLASESDKASSQWWGISSMAWSARLALSFALFLAQSDRSSAKRFRVISGAVIFVIAALCVLAPPPLERWYYVPQLTAMTLVLFGMAAVYGEVPQERTRAAVPWFAAAGIGLNALTLLGYIYQAGPLYGHHEESVGIMAGIVSVLIGAGYLARSGTSRWPLRLMHGQSISAQLLRALLPVTALAMLLGELASDFVRNFGLGERALQDALQTMLSTVFIIAVVSFLARRVGRRLEQAESRRAEAERELAALNDSLAAKIACGTEQLRRANDQLTGQILRCSETERALRQSEEKNSALLAALPDWIVRSRKDGVLLDVRKPHHKPAPEALERELLPLLSERIRTIPRSGFLETVHLRLPSSGGTYEARFVIMPDENVLAVVRDISELARLEAEVIEAGVREQGRIGEELHDGVGQQLTALAFRAKLLELDLAEKNLPQAREAAELGREASASVASIRTLARGLFRNELGADSLPDALLELAHSSSKAFHVQCTVDVDAEISFPNPTASLHLYRISQEAINNAVKHGRARRIHLALKQNAGQITFSIRDDGAGADFRGGRAREGIGLRTMEFRTRRLGGRLGVESKPGEGTLITCTVPDLRAEPCDPCDQTNQLLLFP